MSETYLIAYDGTDGSRRAARFAAQRASLAGADLHVLHVLEWSPYSFLTAEELDERHRRRQEELDRASRHVVEPLVTELSRSGRQVTSEVRYGHVAEVICEVAEERSVQLLFVGRTGESKLVARVLGSVPGALVQMAPVPVTVVP